MYIVAVATSSGWTQHFPNLKKVIDDLISARKVDPQRVYITGFSMGGRGTWDFINAYPNYFAASIPMGMAPAGDFENARKIQIQIKAVDIDGSIEKVELFKYNVLIATINQLSNGFYNAELEILDGDTKISAKAYDNKGKTAISISFFPSAVGTANLTVTIKDDAGIDLNGKDSYQQTFKITVLSQFNSLYNVKSESTNFYPNPTVKTLHSNKPLQLVAVFGINGLKLKEFTNTQEINISDLAAGSYISRYIDETGKNGKQLIVKME